jgi:hypothetical protein
MGEWANGRMGEWAVGEWANGRMGEWAMGEWANGRMGEWANGRMGEWAMGDGRMGDGRWAMGGGRWAVGGGYDGEEFIMRRGCHNSWSGGFSVGWRGWVAYAMGEQDGSR